MIETANRFCAFFGLKTFPPLPAEDELRAHLEKRKATADRAKARARKKALAEAKQAYAAAMVDVERWKQGENVRLDRRFVEYDLMRVEGTDVVTTQSATVPVSHVRRLAPLMLHAVSAGVEWIPDHEIRFGHYRLSSVSAEGTVRIGCHTFLRAEIERIGSIILAMAPPAAVELEPAGV
jgi:hypothetical protein